MNTNIKIEGERIHLSGNEPIVYSVIGYDLLTLGIRSASFSNIFNVPANNQKNRDILNVSELINSTNDEPYKSLTAIIDVDGSEVVNGVATLEGFDGNNYQLSIKSGDGNFFQLIKSVSLTSLADYLTPLTHDYSIAGVEALRDKSTGIVYPNIDYGFFDKADTSTYRYDFFLPSLYLKFIIDSAIELIGYRTIGDLWTDDVYSTLAIPAKNVVGTNNDYIVDYEFINGVLPFGLLSVKESVYIDNSIVKAPINFPSVITDADGLYRDTTITGLGYITFGYNFPSTYSALTTFEFNLNGQFTTNSPQSFYRNLFVTSAIMRIQMDVYNKTTGAVDGIAFSFEYEYYTATYIDQNGTTNLTQEIYSPTIPINIEVLNAGFLASIAGTATNFVMVWKIESEIEFSPLETKPAAVTDNLGSFSFSDFSMNIEQIDNAIIPSTVNVLDSFEDINVGNAFLYTCNVMGVFPKVDEYNKTIELVRVNDVVNNKPNALDWSEKLDLSTKPKVSFKLGNYAQSNYFQYSNDESDPFLSALTNYGRGTFSIADTTIDLESEVYTAPFSLCAIDLTLLNDTRSMAKIFTGNKYIFDGTNYNLDPDAKIEGFKTRIVKLNRSTTSLLQITGGTTIAANYEVANNNILFQNVLNQRFSLLNDATKKTKVVECFIRLTTVDIENFDSTIPIWIDYFNDYFYINNVSEFNLTASESTLVTLIRL